MAHNSNIISLADEKASRRDAAQCSGRFLDYVTFKELEVLTQLRSGNRGGALAAIARLLPDADIEDVALVVRIPRKVRVQRGKKGGA